MIKNEDTYCIVQHKIVREVGAVEAVIYGTIVGLLRKTDGIGEVSNQQLMDLCGVKRASLFRYINNLIESGYIEKREGNGRGNISIYYITKKGLNLIPFSDKKGSQFETKRVSKIDEKGLNLSTINKDNNKEYNKESDGDMREAQSPPLSITTTKNLNNMEDFNLFWSLYPDAKDYPHEQESCERVWSLMQPEWRAKLISQLQNGQRWREHTGTDRDNPIWYLRNYQGQDIQAELPYIRQGSQKFIKWQNDNIQNGNRMCLIHFEGRVANCLYSDLDIMINAGAKVLNDNWK